MRKTTAYRFLVYGLGITFRVECQARHRECIMTALAAQGFQLILLAEYVKTPADLPYEPDICEWIGAN
jgi:hypothetical protein